MPTSGRYFGEVPFGMGPFGLGIDPPPQSIELPEKVLASRIRIIPVSLERIRVIPVSIETREMLPVPVSSGREPIDHDIAATRMVQDGEVAIARTMSSSIAAVAREPVPHSIAAARSKER